MCLPLVARVEAVAGDEAEVELLGNGTRARVSVALFPEAGVGQHVLVDRGLVIDLIEPDEAEELLAFYAELAEAWDEIEEGTAAAAPTEGAQIEVAQTAATEAAQTAATEAAQIEVGDG